MELRETLSVFVRLFDREFLALLLTLSDRFVEQYPSLDRGVVLGLQILQTGGLTFVAVNCVTQRHPSTLQSTAHIVRSFCVVEKTLRASTSHRL